MIVLLVVITVGWVLLAVFGALEAKTDAAAWYWIALPVGTTFIVLVLLGVVLYLVLTIKTINLAQRQSNFIDAVTHELKTPIASMKLYLQTLTRRQVDQQQQDDFHRIILEDVERLDLLINRVLDAQRLETGRTDGDVEDVAMEPLLRECVEEVCLRYRVPLSTVDLDIEPCTIRAKYVDLDLIFRNLVDNAVKYAGNEPRVEVTLRRTPEGVGIVRVGDNGRGIPPKFRRKIFGRFVRLGSELEREKPGTGLGLHIVHTLVTRLKGKIRVQPRDGTPGTVFEVELPHCRLGDHELGRDAT